MFKTALRTTLAAGAALAASVALGTTASAGVDDVELPDVNIGNNACVLPWFWQGPFNVAVGDQNGSYVACNGSSEEAAAEGVNILNDACIAPWFWQGPVNFLVGSQNGYYEACNTY